MAEGTGSDRVPQFQTREEKWEWYVTEGGRRVRWNAYAMNLGGRILDSVGFPLIDNIEEKEVGLSKHNRLD